MEFDSLVKNLEKRGFKAIVCQNGAEAVQTALKLIPEGVSVGVGGSLSVKQLELDTALSQNGRTVYSHRLYQEPSGAVAADFIQDGAATAPPKRDLYSMAASADWYVSSANAVTQGGEIINIDGTCNRISSLAYGVPNILYVIGENKVTENLDAAIDRARNVAAPPNAKRLGRRTPCVVTGKCHYCNSPDCICNATLIVHHPSRMQENVYVLLVKEVLGY